MTATVMAPPPATLADRVVETFRAAGRPLTFAELKKALPKPQGTGSKKYEEELRDALLGAERAGRLYKWSPKDEKETPRFAARAEHDVAEELAHGILANGDLTATKLASELEKRLPKVWPGKRRLEFLDELLAAKRLHKAGTKLSVNPPDAAAILDKVLSRNTRDGLRRAAEAFQKAGLDTDKLLESLRPLLVAPDPTPAPATPQVPATPPTPKAEVQQLILKGLLDIEPTASQGTSVPLAELRRHLPAEYRVPAVFDTAIRALVSTGEVVAKEHTAPESVTDDNMAELVPDGRGGYIVGIARRVHG
ncbi:MAG: hypothetical protein U0746_11335 [Gemmataceae bacterium]